MPKSETLGKLAEALAKAQSEIQHAHKDKDNPFFKSSYADLASVWDACREPLSKNGLSVVQALEMTEKHLILNSTLMHISGEWISSLVPIVPVKPDPQGYGSAITYMRRFTLAALVGVAPSEKPTPDSLDDDDDGESAMGRRPLPGSTKPIVKHMAMEGKPNPSAPVREPVYRPAPVQPKSQSQPVQHDVSDQMPEHMKQDVPPWEGYR